MALSLIPLVSPLYSVHKNYEEVFERFGDKIYINSLIDPSSTPRNAASPQIVSDMLVAIYDGFISMYNIRVSINNGRLNENMVAKQYYATFLILILVGAIVCLGVFAWMMISSSESPRIWGKFVFEACLFIAVMVLTIQLCLIATYVLKRRLLISNTYNKTTLEVAGGGGDNPEEQDAGTGLQLHATIRNFLLNLKPDNVDDIFNISDNLDVLKYEDLEADKDDVPIKKFIIAHVKYVKGVMKQKDYDTVMSAAKASLVKVGNVPISHIFTEQVMTGESSISERAWHPDLLYRAIRKLDVIGQGNQMTDSVAYFNKLLLKEYNTADSTTTDEQKQGIINSMANAMKSTVVTTSRLIPMDIDKLTRINDVRNIDDCTAACMGLSNAVGGYYNERDNVCGVIKGPGAGTLRYNDGTQQGTGIIKGVKGVSFNIVSGYSKTKPSPYMTSVVGPDAYGGATLTDNTACYAGSNVLICTDKFISQGSPNIRYWDLMQGGSLGTGGGPSVSPGQLVVKVPAQEIVNSEGGTIVSTTESFLQSKTHYINACERVLKNADPKLVFVMSTETIEQVVQDVKAYYGLSDDAFVSTIRDVLVSADKARRAPKKSVEDIHMSKYVDVATFATNISEMTQREFFDTFVLHCQEMQGCSDGLYKIYNYYNIVEKIAAYSQKILDSMFLTIIFATSIAIFYYAMRDGFLPVKAKTSGGGGEDKNMVKQIEYSPLHTSIRAVSGANAKNDIFKLVMDYALSKVAVVCIIVIFLVFIQAYKSRTKAINSYNTAIIEQNGQTIKTASLSVIKNIYDVISQGGIVSIVGVTLPDNQGKVEADTYDRLARVLKLSDVELVDPSKMNVEFIHGRLIESIEAYNKCNALLMGVNTKIPFPTFEITLYTIILLVTLSILLYTYVKLRPVKMVSDVKYYQRLQDQMKKNIFVPDNELELGVPRENKEVTMYISKCIALILIPIITVILATNVMSAGNSLQYALYASDLYRTANCYNIDG